MNDKEKLVFRFNGETYTGFKAYGRAIAERYYPEALEQGKDSADHFYGLYADLLQGLCRADLAAPCIASAYNYCRAYYQAIIVCHTPAGRLLDTYTDLHTRADALSICKAEAVRIYISEALNFLRDSMA